MNTINHEYYVSLEVAKLLKEAGFDWKCRGIYVLDSENDPEYVFSTANFTNTSKEIEGYIRLSAPTLEIAQRWLREVKHLNISIHYDPTIKSKPYVYSIYDVEEKFDDILGIISPVTHSYSDGYFYTYEEAQESGIKKALELILEKGE